MKIYSDIYQHLRLCFRRSNFINRPWRIFLGAEIEIRSIQRVVSHLSDGQPLNDKQTNGLPLPPTSTSTSTSISDLNMDQPRNSAMSQKAITRKGDAQVLARYYPNVPLTPHISDLKRTTWNDSSSTLDGQTNISERTSFSSTRPLCSTPSLSSFKPGWQLYLSFSILSIVGLAASLDATSISPALPVSLHAQNETLNLTIH